jgi:hypothetical protein
MWRETGLSTGLTVVPTGVPSLSTFNIEGFEPLVVKTFITQEMIKNGFIAGTSLYASIAHESFILEKYQTKLQTVFKRISDSETSNGLEAQLDAGTAQAGFRRLT